MRWKSPIEFDQGWTDAGIDAERYKERARTIAVPVALIQIHDLPKTSTTTNSGGTPQRTGTPLVPIPLVT
jgi:hypothetical protein